MADSIQAPISLDANPISDSSSNWSTDWLNYSSGNGSQGLPADGAPVTTVDTASGQTPSNLGGTDWTTQLLSGLSNSAVGILNKRFGLQNQTPVQRTGSTGLIVAGQGAPGSITTGSSGLFLMLLIVGGVLLMAD